MKQDTAIQVLVIEDDVRIAEINRRFVERVDGYQVVGIATNELEAKEHLAILHPDLVLLDIYFPDMDGFELLQFPETLSRYRSFRKRLDALMKENPKVDQQAIDELMQSIEPKNWLQSYDGPEIFRVFGRARSGTS
ncbi:hypothetical protein AAC03nite_12710 [Alicyclobacillus acidoterrestris]|nr:hypothetical protein AAC03nite_12710 [Alicyclobacillus acidoterrestris]